MITMSELQKALIELLYEIKDTQINLIIAGGFGIYLRTEYIRKLGYRTLFPIWPEPRSTNDLDLFIRPELLIHPENLKPMAEAIKKLGYEVVKGAEKYQFIKSGLGGGKAGSIKIDLLTGPREMFTGTLVRVDERRAKPKPSIGLHAHPVTEAPTLEYELMKFPLEAKKESGDYFKTDIYIPHPYTFLVMKLFAFRDRKDDPEKDFGRYHALDLYTILATTTESEWEKALNIRDEMIHSPIGKESARIVSEYFAKPNQIGIIRFRESPYYHSELMLDKFISALGELFRYTKHF